MPEGQVPKTPSRVSDLSEATPDLSIEEIDTSGVALHHLDIPVRNRCGVRRMGRKHAITYEYWVPCGRRRCTLCAPKLAARRMNAVDDVVLYGLEVNASQRNAVKQQIKRARQRGEDAAYIVIPTGYDTLLYVSETEIGYSIDRKVVEAHMLDARTEWGNITSSKDWRPLKVATSRADGFQDCGMVTAEQEHLEQAARFLGLDTIETIWDLRWHCDDPKHLQLLRAAGVMSDRDYWAMILLGQVPTVVEKPDWWTGESRTA